MIYLIDPYGKVGFGHFWLVTNQFVTILNLIQEDFVLVTPSPEKVAEEFNLSNENSCVEILRYTREHSWVEFLQSEIVPRVNQSKEKNILLFTWLPSISEYDFLKLLSQIESGHTSVVGISTLKQSSVINYGDDYKFEYQEIFEKSDKCKILWVWHTPNARFRGNSKIRRLPEYHPASVRKKQKKQNTSSKKTIGFFGGLNSMRGLSEILLIGLFNPKLEVRVKGYGFSAFRTWRFYKYPWTRYTSWRKNPIIAIGNCLLSLVISILRFLPNVDFDIKPFVDEAMIDEYMLSIDYFFYGGKTPHSSGMSLKALASGVPVVWFGKVGEAVRILKMHSTELEIRYWEIFIPFRISRMLTRYKGSTEEVFTLNSLIKEVSTLKTLL